MDKPQAESILVSLDRLHHCPKEVGDECWPPDKRRKKAKPVSAQEPNPPIMAENLKSADSGPDPPTMVLYIM